MHNPLPFFRGREFEFGVELMLRSQLRPLTLPNGLLWLPKWSSFQNTSSYTWGVSIQSFRGCRIRIWGQIKYSRHFWGHWGRPRSLKDLLNVNHCKIIINTCFEILRCVRGDILKWPPFRRSKEAIGQRRWPQLTSKHQSDPKFEFSTPKNLGKDTPHV